MSHEHELLMKGRSRDLNIRGAFLHMAADAGVSVGVVLAGLLIHLTGLLWVDPVMSLVVLLVIVCGHTNSKGKRCSAPGVRYRSQHATNRTRGYCRRRRLLWLCLPERIYEDDAPARFRRFGRDDRNLLRRRGRNRYWRRIRRCRLRRRVRWGGRCGSENDLRVENRISLTLDS